MKNFDKAIAQAHLDQLLKEHNIKVTDYSVSSCGYAVWKTRSIKIPKPTNIDRFGVCMHEIKHIIDGKKGTRFEQEFACDIYALEQIVKMGWDTLGWIKRTRWHSLSRIAMAVNRGYHPSKINDEIKDFFKDIDFTTWCGNKVFVSTDRKYSELKIELTIKLSREEVEVRLNRQGLMLEKSQIHDSTYGKWRVFSNGDRFGDTFEDLTHIIYFYKMQL